MNDLRMYIYEKEPDVIFRTRAARRNLLVALPGCTTLSWFYSLSYLLNNPIVGPFAPNRFDEGMMSETSDSRDASSQVET